MGPATNVNMNQAKRRVVIDDKPSSQGLAVKDFER